MQELINRLKTDAAFLIEVIVWNNPGAVLAKFATQTDTEMDSEEAIIAELDLYQQQGLHEVVSDVLAVPFLEGETSSNELNEAFTYLRDRSGNLFNGLYQSVQAEIDKENTLLSDVKTAEQLTAANPTAVVKDKTVINVTSIALLALIIILAIFIASKIKIK